MKRFSSKEDPNLTFVLHALPLTGLEVVIPALQDEGYLITEIAEADRDDLTISLVSHPLVWLHRVYNLPVTQPMQTNEHYHRILQIARHSLSFDAFCQAIVQCAGIVYEAFSAIKADSVLRMEDFPWNFVELLKSFEAPAEYLKTHEFQAWPEPSPQMNDLRRQLVKSEQLFCEAYDYL